MKQFILKDSRVSEHIVHSSTKTSISLLEALIKQGFTANKLLDIGAGSGLLSFYAASQWPDCAILAGDISRLAVDEMRENIATNGFQQQIQCVQADGVDHPDIQTRAPYQLIMANMLAKFHVQHLQQMQRLLAADGYLLLSGILNWRRQEIEQAIAYTPLTFSATLESDQWLSLLLIKE